MLRGTSIENRLCSRLGGLSNFTGDTTCRMILGLDPSIKAVMIADLKGGLIAHRVSAKGREEAVISDETPHAVPFPKKGIVVFLRIAGQYSDCWLLSAVEELCSSFTKGD